MGNMEKQAAARLRALARQYVRRAADLATQADELDPPPGRTIETTGVETCTCNRCGDQVKGLNWIGDRCLISKDCNGVQIRCAGLYRLDPEIDEADGVVTTAQDAARDIAQCDVCGLRISDGRANDGEPCGAVRGFHTCPGHFRLPAGLTDDELAQTSLIAEQQAIRADIAEALMDLDLDELSDREDTPEDHALDALIVAAVRGVDVTNDALGVAATFARRRG